MSGGREQVESREKKEGRADLIRFDVFGKHPQSRLILIHRSSLFCRTIGFGMPAMKTPKTFDSAATAEPCRAAPPPS
jgi:hypothetical protein